MGKILIYSSEQCPYCVRAKQLLDRKNATYTEIRVDQDPEQLKHMIKITGKRTVPQIFIGERHVGGFDDLYALEQAGELDPLLDSIR
jgi:glutaredoxin 3